MLVANGISRPGWTAVPRGCADAVAGSTADSEPTSVLGIFPGAGTACRSRSAAWRLSSVVWRPSPAAWRLSSATWRLSLVTWGLSDAPPAPTLCCSAHCPIFVENATASLSSSVCWAWRSMYLHFGHFSPRASSLSRDFFGTFHSSGLMTASACLIGEFGACKKRWCFQKRLPAGP